MTRAYDPHLRRGGAPAAAKAPARAPRPGASAATRGDPMERPGLLGAATVAGRILLGLRGDRATLAFVVGAPVLILFLFGEVVAVVPPGRFDTAFLQPALMGVFLFILTYVLTGVGFLRERQQGTLERMLVSPLGNASIVAGYLLGFGALAVVQATVLLGAGLLFLDLSFAHAVTAFYAVELLAALTALGIGILFSLVARTEFQVLQGIPVIIAPQIILGGVFVPVERLPLALELVARALPLTYILDAMAYLILDEGSASDLWISVAVLGGYVLATLGAASLLVRRRG
jgi:ABC-2 type transport system permease protein